MGCGTSCVKYLMFFINFLFVLAGIGLIVVGSLIQAQVNDVADFLDSKFSAPPIALIVLGVIVFIIAFYGCCGAIRESSCMLITFAVFLMVILIAEIVIAILAFVYHSDTENLLVNALKEAYNQYNENKPDAVNTVQRAMKCCGFNKDNMMLPDDDLPGSCCGRGSGDKCLIGDIYTTTCQVALLDFVSSSGLILGGVAIGIAVVLIFGIGFGLCLASSFRRGRTV